MCVAVDPLFAYSTKSIAAPTFESTMERIIYSHGLQLQVLHYADFVLTSLNPNTAQ